MHQLLSFAAYLTVATSIFAMLSFSLDLQLGSCGLVNFGQVAFLLVGGYATAIATGAGASPARYAAGRVGRGGVRRPARADSAKHERYRPGYSPLALAELVRLIVLNEQWIGGGAGGSTVLTGAQYFYPFVVGTAVAVFLLIA